ncbi:NADH-quinone oxidoreductase subunit NuoF [Candidatus Mycalebacterium sp.]
MPETKIIRNYTERGADSRLLRSYLESGGYEALKKAISMEPEEITEIVKQSGLRGRGGAGFPTGLKWNFIPRESGNPVYLCCNADESEPGSFKDREIIERDPHQIIEGMLIAARAVGAEKMYIYIRGEMPLGAEILENAVEEAREGGYLGRNIMDSGFGAEISVFRGAGAYICGEETGMLESIEGKNGEPRPKPPFPAQSGLFHSPTVINNVETLACVPHIINRGSKWFSSIGTPKNTGIKIFGLSGCVNRPGLYELPLGVPLRELIYEYGGGIPEGRQIKAVSPGGSSSGVLTEDELDIAMDFDTLNGLGTMLGTAGVTVMDETVSMVSAARNLAHFYRDESCGQCVQCREGTWWLEKMLGKIEDGSGDPEHLDIILDACSQMTGKTICALADGCAMPVSSMVKKFRSEFEQTIADGGVKSSHLGKWK